MTPQKGSLGLAKICKFWFPVALYSGIIFCVSSLPKIKPPLEGFNVDKVFHILEYIPFGYLAARALFHTKNFNSNKNIIFLAALLAFVYGITDEVHQSFVEGRYATFYDVMADTIGGFLGALLYLKCFKREKNQTEET